MKKAIVERNLVVILFILVLVVFSFAERDTKKLERIYKTSAESIQLKKATELAKVPAMAPIME